MNSPNLTKYINNKIRNKKFIINEIKGDASNRKYYRAKGEKENLIIMDSSLEKRNFKVSAFLYLRPTQPLRTTKEINEAIKLYLSNKDIECVRTTVPTKYPPFWSRVVEKNNTIMPLHPSFQKLTATPRQKLPTTVICDGHVDIFNATQYIKKQGENIKCLSLSKNGRTYFDLDTKDDWEQCEKYMKKVRFANKS